MTREEFDHVKPGALFLWGAEVWMFLEFKAIAKHVPNPYRTKCWKVIRRDCVKAEIMRVNAPFIDFLEKEKQKLSRRRLVGQPPDLGSGAKATRRFDPYRLDLSRHHGGKYGEIFLDFGISLWHNAANDNKGEQNAFEELGTESY